MVLRLVNGREVPVRHGGFINPKVFIETSASANPYGEGWQARPSLTSSIRRSRLATRNTATIASVTTNIKLPQDGATAPAPARFSRRGLLAMVAKRRKLLDYLKRVDEKRYQSLIERLGIRR